MESNRSLSLNHEPETAAPPEPIPIAYFSTTPLPPVDRYAAWLEWGWPRIDAIYHTEPAEPFDTTFESAMLGDILFVRTRITGMRWRRRLDDIRRSDFDPIIINIMVEGLAHGDCDGRAFREEAGMLHFHDLSKPSDHVSTASLTYAVVMSRQIASKWFGSLDDLHGRVVGGASAALVLAHAGLLWDALPLLHQNSASALGGSLLNLLVAASASAPPAVPPAEPPCARLRAQAAAQIETRLNKAPTVEELCVILQVSRTALSAAFRSDGGVQNFIRTMRVDTAKAALADLERREPIGTIALRLGFYDASHLTRLFRARFGMTPRDYRRSLAADR